MSDEQLHNRLDKVIALLEKILGELRDIYEEVHK